MADSGDISCSDADHMVKQLQERGYSTVYHFVDAREYGSFAARKRVYFLGPIAPTEDAASISTQILQGCMCGPGTYHGTIWVDEATLSEMETQFPDAEVALAKHFAPRPQSLYTKFPCRVSGRVPGLVS